MSVPVSPTPEPRRGKWCVGCGSPIGPDDEEGPGVEFPQGMHHFQCWESRHHVDPDAPVSSPTPDEQAAEEQAYPAAAAGWPAASSLPGRVVSVSGDDLTSDQAEMLRLNLEIDQLRAECAQEFESGNVWCERALASEAALVVVREQLTQAQRALQRFADHGLSADLNPTIDCTNAATCYDGFRRYLERLDAHVRESAAAGLAILSSPPTYTTEEPSSHE